MSFTTDDILEWNRDNVEETLSDEDEENVEVVDQTSLAETRIKHADAIQCLETCIQWSQQNGIDISKSLILRELQEEAVQKSLHVVPVQKSIKDYFN